MLSQSVSAKATQLNETSVPQASAKPPAFACSQKILPRHLYADADYQTARDLLEDYLTIPDSRRYETVASDKLHQAQAALFSAIGRFPPPSQEGFDVIIIGAGTAGLSALGELHRAAPHLNVLAIDASQTPSVFCQFGDFTANSLPIEPFLNLGGNEFFPSQHPGGFGPRSTHIGTYYAASLFKSDAEVDLGTQVQRIDVATPEELPGRHHQPIARVECLGPDGPKAYYARRVIDARRTIGDITKIAPSWPKADNRTVFSSDSFMHVTKELGLKGIERQLKGRTVAIIGNGGAARMLGRLLTHSTGDCKWINTQVVQSGKNIVTAIETTFTGNYRISYDDPQRCADEADVIVYATGYSQGNVEDFVSSAAAPLTARQTHPGRATIGGIHKKYAALAKEVALDLITIDRQMHVGFTSV